MPRGPRPYAETGQPERAHRLSVYCTEDELAALTERAKAVHLRPPAYLRQSALGLAPVVVPAVNRTAILELARVGQLLNQLCRFLHTERPGYIEVARVRAELLAVQRALAGLR